MLITIPDLKMAYSKEAKMALGVDCYEKFLTWRKEARISTDNILEIGRQLDEANIYGDLKRLTEENKFQGGRLFGRELLSLWYNSKIPVSRNILLGQFSFLGSSLTTL